MSTKIIYFIDGMRNGGKERQLMTLLKSLSKNKNFLLTLVLMNKDVHFKEIFDFDINIFFIIRKYRWDLSVFSQFNKLCKNTKADIVHVWDSMTSVYVMPAVLLQKTKFINGSIRHSARPRFLSKFWWVTHLTYPFSHRVVSNSLAGLFAHNKKPDDKYRCIVNGFDTNRICKLKPEHEIRKKFNITTSKIVGMVANFEERKDYTSFIEVAKRILGKRDDVTFLAIGEGKNFLSIMEMIQEKHQERILLPGRQKDVESIINVFDIGLLINNVSGHGEGISNSIMEYMVLSKPVIATDSGGNKEIVLNEETGFIIEPFDVGILVEKIQLLLDDKNLLIEMGRKSKERILSEFSHEKFITAYLNLYKEFLQKDYDQ